MVTGWERNGFFRRSFAVRQSRSLGRYIEASLEDIVLEKPLLRGVTTEPLSDWRTAGFSNEPVSFFSSRTLERSFTSAEGCRPLVAMRLAQLIAARWRC